MAVRYSVASDVGRRRENNEDSYLVEGLPGGGLLVAVADGLGGCAAGEVASALAVRTLRRAVGAGGLPEPEGLREGFRQAAAAVYAAAAQPGEHSGMATTLTAAVVAANELFLGHLGDTRLYLIRDGAIRRLTEDHSVAEEMERSGEGAAGGRENPQRHVLTRALGVKADEEADFRRVSLEPGDRLLLCSDGLTSLVADAELARVLAGTSVERAAQELVRLANERGGYDNITALVVELPA